jgi:hypothetical protein
MSSFRSLTTAAGAALTIVALAAVPAAAQSGDQRTPDARDAGTPAAVSPMADDVRTPDARDASAPAAADPAPEPGAQDVRTPDARDAALGATPVVVHVEPKGNDSGMSWDSAAIGALLAVGLLTAAAGAVTLVSRRRAPRPAV